jgi:hypothetical protein
MESIFVRGAIAQTLAWVSAAAPHVSSLSFRLECDLTDPAGCISALSEMPAKIAGRLIPHLRPRDNEIARAEDFIRRRRALPGFGDCRIHIEGNSSEAAFLAIRFGDVLWRRPDHRNQVYADALPVLHFGKEVGIAIAAGSVRDAEESVAELRRAGISQFLLETPEAESLRSVPVA